ncbi:hypothetical protein HDU93_002973 [Gonapodya sp. JEL0774]|nr:hypothetical protein HDU93_002973 [Gonapodya sp. JEL0774]
MSEDAAPAAAPAQTQSAESPIKADGSPEPVQSKSEKHEWKPDDLVWGFYKGFPVAREEELNDEVLAQRKPNTTCCMFLGTFDYWWFTDSNIRPYEQYRKDFGPGRKKKGGGKNWDKAFELAEDPVKLQKTMEARRAEWLAKWERTAKRQERASEKRKKRDDSEDEDEMDGGESDDERKKRKKHSKDSDESESEEDEEERKKRKEAKKLRREEKERRKAERQKHKEKEGDKEGTEDKHKGDKTDGTVMKLRMKLQKYLLPDSNTPGIEVGSGTHFFLSLHITEKAPSKDEHIAKKASEVLKEVEAAEIDLHALKETKLGKVVKRMATKVLASDPFKLIERCQVLLDKWRKIDVGAEKDDGKEEGGKKLNGESHKDAMEGVQNSSVDVKPPPAAAGFKLEGDEEPSRKVDTE